MEKRRLGKTDMDVSVIGFGGSEIGYEHASSETVAELLNSALDAGLNVIDTAECYYNSEELVGQTVSNRRKEFYLFTKCGHPLGMESGANWSKDSILKSIERSLDRLKTDRLGLVQLHSCSESTLGKGEVIDALQTSISIADQEAIDLTVPLAREKQMGVIAKRPIANAAWKTGHRPIDSYHHEYWERLRKLNYDFLRGDLNKSISIALRFTLSVPGVHTAIVGTKKPERWEQNAKLLEEGPLEETMFHKIRERWEECAPRTWIGQI